MNAKIASFRRGRKTQTPNQAIIVSEEVTSKDAAEKLVGKSVEYKTTGGKTISGKVTGVHGGNGQVRVLFEKGIPGQAMTQTVTLR